MTVIINNSASSNIIRGSNRDTRSESIDSFSSTIDVHAPSNKNSATSSSSDTLGKGVNDFSASYQFFLVNSDENGKDAVKGECHFDMIRRTDNSTSPYSNTHNEILIRKALTAIVVLNSPSSTQVQVLLNAYNGHLIDVGPHLLKGLRNTAPNQLAARVGDWNENLFYEMQDCEKDISSIISDGSGLGNSNDQALLRQDSQMFESNLRKTLNRTNLSYRGSFMRTEQTMYQPAHVDYDYPILKQHGRKLFLAFFPLTEEGAFLQLWKDQSGRDAEVGGEIVFIPHGKMLIVPSDTIHGGGFKRGESGNLRFHLYIAIGDDDEERGSPQADEEDNSELLNHPMNKYTEEHDRRRELCERFVDAHGLDNLLGLFFDA